MTYSSQSRYEMHNDKYDMTDVQCVNTYMRIPGTLFFILEEVGDIFLILQDYSMYTEIYNKPWIQW